MTADEWKIFKNDINSLGVLEWNVGEPPKQDNFLDLALWIDKGRILTKTYQKPTNISIHLTDICPPPWNDQRHNSWDVEARF
ncbi:hypothetical protein ACHAWF_014004 [Thalassiosira exigua]